MIIIIVLFSASSLQENSVCVMLIVIVFVVYGILLMVMHRLDTRVLQKEEIITLVDNKSDDQQIYVITMETGGRPGAGTTATVREYKCAHHYVNHSECIKLYCR